MVPVPWRASPLLTENRDSCRAPPALPGEKQGQMLKKERMAGDNPMSRQDHEGHLESPFEIYEL